MQHSVRATNEELGDLHRGQGLLNELGDPDLECGNGIVGVLCKQLANASIYFEQTYQGVSYHQGMNEGVHKAEDPNGRSHVADTSPHAHHSTGVMVGLQGRALLALGEDDDGVQDLVELAEVENPTVESESLVPQAASVGIHGLSAGGQSSMGRVSLPLAALLAERSSVTQASWPAESAHRVGKSSQTRWCKGADNGPVQSSEHAPECPCRVDGEEDIVSDDKGIESASLADGPWPLVVLPVVDVQELGRDSVDRRNGYGHFGVKHSMVPALGYVEWRRECIRAGRWRRQKGWVRRGRELEEREARKPKPYWI